MDNYYMIVCTDQRRAVYLFKQLCQYLYEQNIEFKANRVSDSINISNSQCIVRFISEERFYTNARYGFRGSTLWSYAVEKFLDEYEREKKSQELKVAMYDAWS